MIRYIMRNGEGLYLNTDYHSAWAKGRWRTREDARLYLNKRGLFNACTFFTPSIIKKIGYRPPEYTGKVWSEKDRETNQRFWKEFRAIKMDEYFSLLEMDGYTIEELNI